MPSSFGTIKYSSGFGLTAVNNATYNSIDISGNNNINGTMYWQVDAGGAATSFTLETTLYLDSDTNGHQYLGLGVVVDMTTSGTTPATDNFWFMIRDGVPEVRYKWSGGAVFFPTAAMRNTGAVGFSVGGTHTLKVDVVVTSQGRQQIAWYWDGILVALITGISTPFSLKPAIMSIGNVTRILSMYGTSPSATTNYVSGNIQTSSQLYRGLIAKSGAAYGFPSTATGVISGLVEIEGTVASRVVRLYNRTTGRIEGQVMSGADGAYTFTNLDPSFEYFAVAHDYQRTFNAVIQDMIQP